MKASIQKVSVNQKSVSIVYLEGRTDSESVVLFREACRQELSGRCVLFNFHKLSLVGSMGLRLFLEAIHSLAQSPATDVRFCAVSLDFQMVLAATPLRYRPILPDIDSALASFWYPAPTLEQLPAEAAEQDYLSLTENLTDDLSGESLGQGEVDRSAGG